MTQEEINKGNEFLDSYMGSEGEYISHKDIWGGEYWGSYKPHNYWGSLDLLVPVIQKIEKEFNITFYLFDNGCELGSMCNDGILFTSYDLSNWSNNVFSVVVSFLSAKKIKNRKSFVESK